MTQQMTAEQRQRMAAKDAADRLEFWLDEQAREPKSQFRSDIERLIRMARSQG